MLLSPADRDLKPCEEVVRGDAATLATDFFDGVAVVTEDLETFDKASGLDDFVDRRSSNSVIAARNLQFLPVGAAVVVDMVEAQPVDVVAKTAPSASRLASSVHLEGGVLDPEAVLAFPLVKSLAVSLLPSSVKKAVFLLDSWFSVVFALITGSLFFGSHCWSFPLQHSK